MKQNRIEINRFHLKLETEQVLRMVDCTKENPLYQKLEGILQKLWKENMNILEPKAFLQEMCLQQEIRGYACLFTLGEKVSREIYRLQRNDMMEAFLLDSLASQLLFQVDEQVQKEIRKLCKSKHHGISARLEAPLDYPLELHQKILEEMEKQGSLPVQVTSGFMLQPEKSMLVFYRWSDKENCMELKHDCTKCPKKDCALRREC